MDYQVLIAEHNDTSRLEDRQRLRFRRFLMAVATPT